MAQKYELKYRDVVNVWHELRIYDDSYSDDVIEIQGRIYLDASSAEDNLESIRGQGLRVELEADADLTFSDLWSEDEQTFPVEYYRNSVLLFDGWLNPEGFYEDYVKTNWVVSFDCIDGLSYLENLSFVNTNGTPITGKKTQLEVLRLALLRTGLNRDINTSIDMVWTGLSTSVNVLANTYVITERYIKDDEETYMSCIDVIKDIIEPYGAVLKGYGDAWYIFKPNTLFKTAAARVNADDPIELTFYNYDYLGAAGTDIDLDFYQILGSHFNNYYPHHANENQAFQIAPSLAGHRISYKYGLLQSLLANKTLCSDDGLTIDDWSITSATNMDALVAGECGVTFNAVQDVSGPPGISIEQLLSDVIQVSSDTSFDFNFKYSTNGLFPRDEYFNYEIIMCDKVITDPTSNDYYLQSDGTWGAAGVANMLSYSEWSITNIFDLTTTTPPKSSIPIAGTGYLYVKIWTPMQIYLSGTSYKLDLNLVDISPSENTSDSNIEGETHTFERTTRKSAQIDNIKEVATGDNAADLYLGTIYENDQTTPTETWNRVDITESKPILQIMGEERMRMQQSPSRIYTGDIYGYIPYLSVIIINGQSGYFMPLEYSYDTYANIIQLKLRQIYGGELDDLDHTPNTDYGNVVTPTIVG